MLTGVNTRPSQCRTKVGLRNVVCRSPANYRGMLCLFALLSLLAITGCGVAPQGTPIVSPTIGTTSTISLTDPPTPLPTNLSIPSPTTSQSTNTPVPTIPLPTSIQPVILSWRISTPACQQAEISAVSFISGLCGGELRNAAFRNQSLATLDYFIRTFRSFSVDTLAGSVVFTGSGTMTATTAEQRMVAEFARSLAAGALVDNAIPYGVFHWHREGGIVGFCDDMLVTSAGEVITTTCRSQQPQEKHIRWLDADEAQRFYLWLDGMKPFTVSHQGPVMPDELIITMVFTGTGSAIATDADKQALQLFGQQLRQKVPQP